MRSSNRGNCRIWTYHVQSQQNELHPYHLIFLLEKLQTIPAEYFTLFLSLPKGASTQDIAFSIPTTLWDDFGGEYKQNLVNHSMHQLIYLPVIICTNRESCNETRRYCQYVIQSTRMLCYNPKQDTAFVDTNAPFISLVSYKRCNIFSAPRYLEVQDF